MLGHSTSTTRKYGGQRYYLCGGYMRKGKEFCEHVSWRKEQIERIVKNKLRTHLLRLTIDDQLIEEINKYHYKSHKQTLSEISSYETEISFLKNRIQITQLDIDTGRAKPFYIDLIEEMKIELFDKNTNLIKTRKEYQPFKLDTSEIQLIQQDLKNIIRMLDDETHNPKSLNQFIGKYTSKIIIQRETKTVHITFHIKINDNMIYQKNISADWNIDN